MKTIVDYELAMVRERLRDRDMTMELDGAAKRFIIDQGYSLEFGARPLKRAISQYIEDPLSEEILKGEFKVGDSILVTVKDNHLSFVSAPVKKKSRKKKSDEDKEVETSLDEQS